MLQGPSGFEMRKHVALEYRVTLFDQILCKLKKEPRTIANFRLSSFFSHPIKATTNQSVAIFGLGLERGQIFRPLSLLGFQV